MGVDATQHSGAESDGRVLGAKHPDTLRAATGLAKTHSRLGKHAEAAALRELYSQLGRMHQRDGRATPSSGSDAALHRANQPFCTGPSTRMHRLLPRHQRREQDASTSIKFKLKKPVAMILVGMAVPTRGCRVCAWRMGRRIKGERHKGRMDQVE